MSNLDETIRELKEINNHLFTINTHLEQKDSKLDECLNVIRKDLWNIKNIIANDTEHHKNIQKSIEKGIERALAKATVYLFVTGIMLYLVGKFFL